MEAISTSKLVVGPVVWASLLLVICGYIGSWLLRQRSFIPDIPIVDCSDVRGAKPILQENYEKYAKKNQPYFARLPAHDVVMLPGKLMTEVKSLPENQVSFSEEVYRRFNGRWTGLAATSSSSAFVTTIAKDLTHNTGKMVADFINEFNEYVMPHEFGTSGEWQTKPVVMLAVRTAALCTSRSFIGLPASRDEAWISTLIAHTRNVFSAGMNLWNYPLPIRGIVAPFTKGIRQLVKDRRAVRAFVQPRVTHRMDEMKNLQPGESPPNDILQWFMKNAPERMGDIDWHTQQQLGLSLAAVHTTGNTLSNLIFDLAAYPEYQEILRDEVLELLDSEGDNIIKKQTITKLRKLDSFLRESMRLNPSNLISVNRFVTAKNGITLSNGLYLPYGSYISTPSAQVNMDSSLWDCPETFDGLRFYKLREVPGNENKYQFVTSNLENITFGQGSHACPGRFFASNLLKVAVMNLVLNYDIKLEDCQGRPDSIFMGTAISPDPKTQVSLRKRKIEVVLEPER